jgi:tRNA threonylcarbamoyladenosine biosynthesis protein TsaE
VNPRRFETASGEETIALGRTLARQLSPPAVVLLIGNLGAGKTTLAKGIVDGLGAASPEEVSSPTFTLIHEYGGGPAPKVYHVDLYRLEEEKQVLGIGLDEILDRNAIVLIEWAERFPRLLPARRIEIHITPGPGETRRIDVTQIGATGH